MLLATCYLLLLLTLLPTRYVSDSYTILIAVFALLRLPLSGIPHQMHVHRHALFELQSQRPWLVNTAGCPCWFVYCRSTIGKICLIIANCCIIL